MHRALDVVVQPVEGGELSGAEVAFVGLSVPGAFRGDGFDVRVTGESDHRAGDDVVAIKFVDHVVDLLAIEAGGCACARFEVNGHAGSSRESDFAPRTLNRCTNMSPGMKMLHEVVLVHENAFAIDTVSRPVRRRVMLMARLFRIEVPIAELTFVYLVAAMGRTVLDVLVVCFPVGESTIAWVAVRHFGRRGSCRDEELSSMEEVDAVYVAWGSGGDGEGRS